MANGSFSSNSSIDIKSTSSHSRMDSRIEDSINLLESQDLATATEIQQIISENLSTGEFFSSCCLCEVFVHCLMFGLDQGLSNF